MKWDEDDERDWDPVDEDAADEPTYPCPGCGQPVYELADACPRCGEYLSFDDPRRERKPWWIWVGVWLGVLAVVSVFIYMLGILLLTMSG